MLINTSCVCKIPKVTQNTTPRILAWLPVKIPKWSVEWDMTCRALHRIKVYQMYRYFGYDMVDNISNQMYRFTRYVSKYIFGHIKSFKVLLLPILSIFDSAKYIVIHIVYRFKVSMIWYISDQYSDTEL